MVWDRPDLSAFDDHLEFVAVLGPWTFGAALRRASELRTALTSKNRNQGINDIVQNAD